MNEISERQELSRILGDIMELREKSSYKKTYEGIIKTLKRKLERMTFRGGRAVDNAPKENIDSII